MPAMSCFLEDARGSDRYDSLQAAGPAETAKAVIHGITRHVGRLLETVDDPRWIQVVERLAVTPGKIVASGVGKSGIAARKIAATFSAVGIPAFYLDPLSALHGDLGAISAGDAAVLVSRSGTTREVVDLVPHLRDRRVEVIALIGVPGALLANLADVALATAADSTSDLPYRTPLAGFHAAVALGETLAMGVWRVKGGSLDDLARGHPYGDLPGGPPYSGSRDTESGADLR